MPIPKASTTSSRTPSARRSINSDRQRALQTLALSRLTSCARERDVTRPVDVDSRSRHRVIRRAYRGAENLRRPLLRLRDREAAERKTRQHVPAEERRELKRMLARRAEPLDESLEQRKRARLDAQRSRRRRTCRRACGPTCAAPRGSASYARSFRRSRRSTSAPSDSVRATKSSTAIGVRIGRSEATIKTSRSGGRPASPFRRLSLMRTPSGRSSSASRKSPMIAHALGGATTTMRPIRRRCASVARTRPTSVTPAMSTKALFGAPGCMRATSSCGPSRKHHRVDYRRCHPEPVDVARDGLVDGRHSGVGAKAVAKRVLFRQIETSADPCDRSPPRARV